MSARSHRSNQASSNILRLSNPPLTPKWTAALDWLDGELERRQVYPQYTDWGRSALQISNENSSNSTFLERSNSARTLLAKAREVFPSTPPADALKQAAAGAKGAAAPARAGIPVSSTSKSEQPVRPNASVPTKSDVLGPNSGRSGAFTSPQPQQRSPTVDEGDQDDEDQQLLGQSGEDGGEGETPAEYDAMDEDEADDEGERGGPSDDEDDVPETENYPSGLQLGSDHRSPPINAEHPPSGPSGTRRAPPPYEGHESDVTKQHAGLAHGLQTPVNLGFGSATEQELMPEVFIPSGADEARPMTSNEPASRPPSPSSQPPATGGRIESTNL